jgi:DNA-binding NarL/FixJ family response regulator
LPVILSIGYLKQLLEKRNELLKRHGFQVISATSPVEVLAVARDAALDIAIFGHGVPANDRNAMAESLRAIHGNIQFIFLYREHASCTELADAILNVNGSASDLIETLRYLMERKAALERGRPSRGTAVRATS